MSAIRENQLRRRMAFSATAIFIAVGLGAGPASAAPIHANSKAALGDVFSCQKHKYPWC